MKDVIDEYGPSVIAAIATIAVFALFIKESKSGSLHDYIELLTTVLYGE